MQQRRSSRIIVGLVALGLLAGVALTAGPAQAADSSIDPDVSSPVPLAAGLGPYYALPSWDRKIAPANRFVVLTDWSSAAVLDKETGLVWEKTPSSSFTGDWATVRDACLSLKTGGRTGWRLPAVHELTSLIQPSGFFGGGPTLPPGHPFTTGATGVQVAFYWTATTNAEDPTLAWLMYFLNGDVGTNNKGVNTLLAWCVRGGNNAAVY